MKLLWFCSCDILSPCVRAASSRNRSSTNHPWLAMHMPLPLTIFAHLPHVWADWHSKTGSNRAQNTATENIFVGVLVLLMYVWFCLFFVGGLIIPKWLINDSWSIAICFYDFWNDQKCGKIRTLGPRIDHQNTSTNARTYGGGILDNIISYLRI